MNDCRLTKLRRVLIVIISIFVTLSCSTGTTPTYELNTSASPAEGGSVSPAEGQYDKGDQVEMTAESSENWVFDKWQGDYSGSENPAMLTIDSDMNITASFKKREYALTMNTEGEGIVQEEVIQEKSTDYKHGTVVELTAKPSEGWIFTNWEGDLEGNENPRQITVQEETSVTAVFEQRTVKLEVVSGNNQHATPGSTLQNPLVVKTVDQNDDPVGDIQVEFAVTQGGGSITPQTVQTNSEGLAEAQLTLAQNLEETQVTAETKDLPDYLTSQIVEFTAIAEMQLDQWLSEHNKITDAINWETPNGVLNYENWTTEQKNALNEMYLRVVNKSLTLENYPPENLYELTQDPEYTRVETRISLDDAWDLYLMNVANSIAVEKNNIVSWSLQDSEYSERDLKLLLDGRYFYNYKGLQDGTHIYEPITDPFSSYVLPSQPQVAMEFFKREQILSSTRLETIYRLIDWSAVNLRHFLGPYRLGNFEDHWHYAGAIPVDRIIKGTDRKDDDSDKIFHHTAGCHGTNHFYTSILRNLNIPVEYDRAAGHATPYFTMQNLYLSHGDDPYNAFYAQKPVIHPKKLLIDEQKYNDWFDYQTTSNEERLNNIGRQAFELGLDNLSYYLLGKYCYDKSQGLSKEEGEVFDTLSRHYTLEELKEMNLWQKMDDKLSDIGGCDNVDKERVPYY